MRLVIMAGRVPAVRIKRLFSQKHGKHGKNRRNAGKILY